jgi:hypothetical protein
MSRPHHYFSTSELLAPFGRFELVGVTLITLACLLLLVRGESSVAWFSALALLIAGLANLSLAIWHGALSDDGVISLRTTEPEAEMPLPLRESLAELASLPDEALRCAALEQFPEQAARDLEAFNLKQQREGLGPSEESARDELLAGYERVMLLRAEAARLLTQRGHDGATLLGDG